MVLGALVDAGADLRAIEAELRRLGLEGWDISAHRVRRGAISATHVRVATREEHHHRGLAIIVNRIRNANLAPRAAERAVNIFHRLAEAEARVHGVPVEQVHFHEVGAADSIVDIVGAAVGFELLEIDEFFCSPLDVGAGQVQTAHGTLPVPAPATVELLRGAPVFSSGIQRELVTPTGAAIATTLAASYGEMPAMSLRAVGCGAGSAENAEKPNVLRLLIGEAPAAESGEFWGAPVTALEANLDDMSPQLYGYFAEKALEAGALDVFSTPAQMKKGRPGILVTILCAPEHSQRLAELLFRETTTIGVRARDVRRKTLDRELVPVETPFGEVRMKISRLNGTVLNAAPEYEDCRTIAAARCVPLKQVMAAAALEYERQSQPRAVIRGAARE